VHGSVSQLLDDAGNVKASYGYTAYGASDAPSSDTESLTSGDPDPQAPLNPYRYASRRIDSGTVPSTTPAVASGAAGYDMGARRFGPDLGAFLQQDQFAGALADLGLALDPLTQNRYALAGGNPISYVEWDGHFAINLQQLENTITALSPGPDPDTQRLINANTQPQAGKAEAGSTVDLSHVTLAAATSGGTGGFGTGQLHNAVRDELLRRLCPWKGSYFEGNYSGVGAARSD